ncbi:MAG: hypothetical protein M0R00_04950 [Candidatus Omnitrophica bacterium]|jgi:hypothetical protein|nr:hypothetical protein [Candidatus Omnitrophota bacterium]
MEDKIGQQSPEEVARQAAETQKKIEAKRKKAEAYKVAVNSAVTDANVRLLLQLLREICSYDAPVQVVGTNGEIQISSTVFNVGREAVYHDIRKMMSVETKNAVERSE